MGCVSLGIEARLRRQTKRRIVPPRAKLNGYLDALGMDGHDGHGQRHDPCDMCGMPAPWSSRCQKFVCQRPDCRGNSRGADDPVLVRLERTGEAGAA